MGTTEAISTAKHVQEDVIYKAKPSRRQIQNGGGEKRANVNFLKRGGIIDFENQHLKLAFT